MSELEITKPPENFLKTDVDKHSVPRLSTAVLIINFLGFALGSSILGATTGGDAANATATDWIVSATPLAFTSFANYLNYATELGFIRDRMEFKKNYSYWSVLRSYFMVGKRQRILVNSKPVHKHVIDNTSGFLHFRDYTENTVFADDPSHLCNEYLVFKRTGIHLEREIEPTATLLWDDSLHTVIGAHRIQIESN